MIKRVFQWHIYTVDFPDIGGSIQHGLRPAVCISNDTNNTFSDTAQFIPLTSRTKKCLPTHMVLYKNKYPCLYEDSIVLSEQITTLPINRAGKFLGRLSESDAMEIMECIRRQFNFEV